MTVCYHCRYELSLCKMDILHHQYLLQITLNISHIRTYIKLTGGMKFNTVIQDIHCNILPVFVILYQVQILPLLKEVLTSEIKVPLITSMTYRILFIIRGEKLSLFHVFTFIPENLSRLPAFTSFRIIHMQKFAKKLRRLRSNP